MQAAAGPVLIDPTLAYGLMQALLNWGLQFGSRLHWQVTPAHSGGAGAVEVALHVRSTTAPDAKAVHANGLPWLLAQQLAHSDGGVTLQRGIGQGAVQLLAQLRRLPPASAPVAAHWSSARHPAGR